MQILVTVASRHGATLEIGTQIAQVLRDAGHEVDEVDPDDVSDVTPYDAVVLGSAVYVGRLGAALRELVDRQKGQLSQRPVWLFWSGRLGDPSVPVEEPPDVATMAAAVNARGQIAEFGGRLLRADLGVAERALVSMVHAEQGDFRDPEEVAAWASSIVEQLTHLERPR